MLRSMFELGMALLRDGRPHDAIEQHELAIGILNQMPEAERPMRLVASNKYQLAELYRSVNKVALAITTYEESLAAFEAIQNAQGVSVILTQLADTFLYLGELHKAVEHATRVLAAHQAAGLRNRRRCLLLIAQAHAMLGNADAAAAAMLQVDEMSAAGALSAFEECTVLRTRGRLAMATGDLDEARALLEAGRAKASRRDIIEAPVYMLSLEASIAVHLSEIDCALGDHDDAATLAILAAVIYNKTGEHSHIPHCLTLLAEVVDDDFAALLVDTALLPALRTGDSRGLGIALLRSAVIAQGRGLRGLARHRATHAMRHFGHMIDVRRLALARSALDSP